MVGKEIIEFFDGKPAVIEVESSDGEVLSHLIDYATYVFNDGKFDLHVGRSGTEFVYDVFYEDIKKEDGGTLSFEFEGTKRKIRRLVDEDGMFLMTYEMPFPADYMEKMMMGSSEENLSMNQVIEAFSDPQYGEVKGFIYEIDGLGTFFRVDSSWKISSSELAETLDDMAATPLSFQSARNAVEKWDKGEKLNISEINPNEEREE
jgi:hypothetical protein